MVRMYCYSDSAYRARIKFAVLDHNAHVNLVARQHKQTREYQYHRQYRKQTKNWDVVKILEAKEYKYIPDLMKAIQHNWEQYKIEMPIDAQHPTNIQRTIAHTQPPDTHTIVNKKKSRFT